VNEEQQQGSTPFRSSDDTETTTTPPRRRERRRKRKTRSNTGITRRRKKHDRLITATQVQSMLDRHVESVRSIQNRNELRSQARHEVPPSYGNHFGSLTRLRTDVNNPWTSEVRPVSLPSISQQLLEKIKKGEFVSLHYCPNLRQQLETQTLLSL